MLSLREIQRKFKQQILDHQENTRFISDGERLAVYSDGYLARLVEALEETYETIRQILGHVRFVELCERYVKRHPSFSYNINKLGDKLPDFLRDDPFTIEIPMLPDLARLEWLTTSAFHAYQKKPFDFHKVSNVNPEQWEKAVFHFQPSIGLISSPWSIIDVWAARKMKDLELSSKISPTPCYVVVYRKEYEVYCEPVDKIQFEVLQSLKDGKPLGQTLNRLKEHGSSLPIFDWFAKWSHLGFIADLKFSS